MSKKTTSKPRTSKTRKISIEGSLELESRSTLPADISLSAFAVDEQGEVLASAEVKPDGKYKLEAGAKPETTFDLVITRVRVKPTQGKMRYSHNMSPVSRWLVQHDYAEIFTSRQIFGALGGQSKSA